VYCTSLGEGQELPRLEVNVTRDVGYPYPLLIKVGSNEVTEQGAQSPRE
jgi:hypothetical protein